MAVSAPGLERLAIPAGSRARSSGIWYVGAVVVGAALIVTTALRQPYSYDEITQITPYGSDSYHEITNATRQPPLDPLLGAIFQHLFGVGQLQQRLVPVLAGIGSLVIVSLLLRRLGLGGAGAFGMWVLATAPLMVRYSAYTRPYALPLFFMLLFAYAAQRWLDQRRVVWLAVTTLAAVALPLTRVPEPTAFLGTAAAALAWFSYRRRLSWRQTWPLVAISLGALAFVGYPMYRSLAHKTEGAFFDPSAAGLADRFGNGLHEIVTAAIPLLGESFPWWPITVLVVGCCLALPASRRRLFGWWFWWPLIAAPVAFLLAYHFLNPFSFYSLPYRARAVSTFVPAYILMVVALAAVVVNKKEPSPVSRVGLSVLLGAALACQLPATADVVLHNAAPDFGEISHVLTNQLPDDAIVLYDRPAPAGQSRQPFIGKPRYMGDTPFVANVVDLSSDPAQIPRKGPVYVLVNGQCARPGRCQPLRTPWDDPVQGWRILVKLERFTLYEPTFGQAGRTGVVEAMRAFGTALGPELGFIETFTAATLLQQQGDVGAAQSLIRRMYADASSDVDRRIRDVAERRQLDPFR